MPARDVQRAAAALAAVSGVEIDAMDLLDPISIDAFAERFVAGGQPAPFLDQQCRHYGRPLTRDSRRIRVSIRHESPWALSAHRSPLAGAPSGQGARVVSVSSRGHWFSPVDYDDPNFEHRSYDPWVAYGQSKLRNVLFAVISTVGQRENVLAFSLHPGGIVETGLAKHMSQEQIRQAGGLDEHGNPVVDPSKGLKNVEQGASTIVWCATSPKLEGIGGGIAKTTTSHRLARAHPVKPLPTTVDALKRGGVKPYAIDPSNARRLWDLSEGLLGISANF